MFPLLLAFLIFIFCHNLISVLYFIYRKIALLVEHLFTILVLLVPMELIHCIIIVVGLTLSYYLLQVYIYLSIIVYIYWAISGQFIKLYNKRDKLLILLLFIHLFSMLNQYLLYNAVFVTFLLIRVYSNASTLGCLFNLEIYIVSLSTLLREIIVSRHLDCIYFFEVLLYAFYSINTTLTSSRWLVKVSFLLSMVLRPYIVYLLWAYFKLAVIPFKIYSSFIHNILYFLITKFSNLILLIGYFLFNKYAFIFIFTGVLLLHSVIIVSIRASEDRDVSLILFLLSWHLVLFVWSCI